MGRFYSLMKDESGQGFIEYGLIICVVSIAAVVVLTFLGPQIATMFNNIALHDALAQ